MAKKNNPPTPEQKRAETDKQAAIAWARRTINDPEASAIDASRAIDILGRLSEYGWFSKPADPRPSENTLSENTAKRICDLAERLLLK